MSKIFKDAVSESVAGGVCPKGFPADLLKAARRKISMVRAAAKLEDLRSPPGNRLHPLVGDRAGQYAISMINIVFAFVGPKRVRGTSKSQIIIRS